MNVLPVPHHDHRAAFVLSKPAITAPRARTWWSRQEPCARGSSAPASTAISYNQCPESRRSASVMRETGICWPSIVLRVLAKCADVSTTMRRPAAPLPDAGKGTKVNVPPSECGDPARRTCANRDPGLSVADEGIATRSMPVSPDAVSVLGSTGRFQRTGAERTSWSRNWRLGSSNNVPFALALAARARYSIRARRCGLGGSVWGGVCLRWGWRHRPSVYERGGCRWNPLPCGQSHKVVVARSSHATKNRVIYDTQARCVLRARYKGIAASRGVASQDVDVRAHALHSPAPQNRTNVQL